MSNNIGYHTRLRSDDTVKLVGGSFGGAVDQETIERLTKVFFTVKILPSGTPVFVDREGREVHLYITVDPGKTEQGKVALAKYRQAQEVLKKIEEEKQDQIQDLIESMDPDEVIRRLTE